MSSTRQTLLWIWLLPVAALFAQQQSASENSALERYAGLVGLNLAIHEDGTELPDGTRSISLKTIHIVDHAAETCTVGSICPVPHATDSLSDSDKALRSRVCQSTAILVGKEVGSKSAITDNRLFIFTMHQVQVTRVLRGQPDIQAGQQIRIAQPGGNIVDGGERVILSFPDLIPSVVGDQYLYFLVRLQDASNDLFVPPSPREDEKIRVSSGRLILEHEPHDSLVSGESVQAVADHVNDLLTKVPCSAK